MRLAAVFWLLLTLLSLVSSVQRKYIGYAVYRLQVESDEQADFLDQLKHEGEYNFLNEKSPLDVLVKPTKMGKFAHFLGIHGVEYEIVHRDIQKLLDARSEPAKSVSCPKEGHNFDWSSYHDLDDIYDYVNFIAANYEYASVESLGQSYEGRDVLLLKICLGGCGNKPAVFINSGMRARDWVSPATTAYLINMLTEEASGVEDYLTQLDWYFVPVVNPDGYEYSWTADRFWKKTRSENEGSACLGTDLYHNFGDHWNGSVNSNECSDSYPGPSAFSEVESQYMKDFLEGNLDQIKFFESILSYGQLVLTPWTYSSDPCPTYGDLEDLALKAADALTAVHGTVYRVGCLPCLTGLTSAGGTPLDYALAQGIKYSYDLMLRDTGDSGFLLPEEQILPTAEEVWAYHVSVARSLIEEFANK